VIQLRTQNLWEELGDNFIDEGVEGEGAAQQQEGQGDTRARGSSSPSQASKDSLASSGVKGRGGSPTTSVDLAELIQSVPVKKQPGPRSHSL